MRTNVLVACATVLSVSSQIGACAKPSSDSAQVAWAESFVEAQFSISGYLLRLETLQDGVDAPDTNGAFVVQCDPARDADWYAELGKKLDDLASQAPLHGPGGTTVASLNHIKAELQSLRERHVRRWSESADLAGPQLRERCLSAAGVAGTRLDVEREMRTILEALLRLAATPGNSGGSTVVAASPLPRSSLSGGPRAHR